MGDEIDVVIPLGPYGGSGIFSICSYPSQAPPAAPREWFLVVFSQPRHPTLRSRLVPPSEFGSSLHRFCRDVRRAEADLDASALASLQFLLGLRFASAPLGRFARQPRNETLYLLVRPAHSRMGIQLEDELVTECLSTVTQTL